jgi:hypothetical protein
MFTDFIAFYVMRNLIHAKALPVYDLAFEKDNRSESRSASGKGEKVPGSREVSGPAKVTTVFIVATRISTMSVKPLKLLIIFNTSHIGASI